MKIKKNDQQQDQSAKSSQNKNQHTLNLDYGPYDHPNLLY